MNFFLKGWGGVLKPQLKPSQQFAHSFMEPSFQLSRCRHILHRIRKRFVGGWGGSVFLTDGIFIKKQAMINQPCTFVNTTNPLPLTAVSLKKIFLFLSWLYLVKSLFCFTTNVYCALSLIYIIV